MSQWSAFRSAIVALPVAALMGCGGGGDGPTGVANQLSPALAADAFDALSDISGFTSLPTLPGPAMRAEGDVGFPMSSFTLDINESEPCPVSGTVRLTGSLTINEETGAITFDIREDYQNCVSTSSSGRQWTFNGNPNVRTVFDFSGETEETFSGSGAITGGFRYSTPGHTGSCTVAVTMTFTALTGSVSGAVCGQAISEQFDLEP